MIEVLKSEKELSISNIRSFKNLQLPIKPEIVKTLSITSSFIDNFGFLDSFKTLKKLVFLACKSNTWSELKANKSVQILRLHNIKQGKLYLDNIDFINTFSSLEYLYINMLGITRFPDIKNLNNLHTICSSNRNLVDFSTLENAPNLKTFIGWPTVDQHKTHAEAFIPILKNPNLKAFDYMQFCMEDKKLKEYIDLTRGAFR